MREAGCTDATDRQESAAPGKTAEPIYYGWIIVTVSLIIGSILAGVRDSFGVFFKSLVLEFHLTRVETSSIYAVHSLLATVFLLVKGWAVDRFAPKLIVISMGLLTALGLMFTSQTHTVWHLYLSYSLLISFGAVGGITVFAPVISRWFDKNRGFALGIVSSNMGLGTIIMAPFSGYMISRFGWRVSYMVMGVLTLVIVVPLALLIKRDPGDTKKTPGVLTSTVGDTEIQCERRAETSDLAGDSLKHALQSRNFWLISSFWSLFALAWGIVNPHIVPYATDRGMSTIQAAIILSTMSGFQIFSRLFVGRTVDRVGEKIPSVVCALLGAGAMVWLIWAKDLWMFYLFAGIFGLSFGGTSVVVLTLTGDLFGKRRLGVITAAIYFGFSIGVAIGSTLAGYVFDVTGSYTVVFIIGAIAVGFIIPLVIPIRRE